MITSHKVKHTIPYLLVISFLILFLVRLLNTFIKLTDIIGIEQNVIYSIQNTLAGRSLYISPANPPFSITQYAPLYYYICSFTAKIIGYTSQDIQALYIIGRSWNILFNFITALLVFRTGRLFGLSKNKSFFLLLLSFAFNTPFNIALRPDSMCDMFSVASVYCFLNYYAKPKKGLHATLQLAFLVLITALAVFSKQSGVQLIFIFGGFTLLIKDWRALIKLILLSVLIYGVFFTGFVYVYKSSFLENVVGGIANGISLKNFFKYVIGKYVFILSVWPVIGIFVFLLIKNNAIFKGSNAEKLLAVCALGALTFATVTGFKMGAGMNYYMLFINLGLVFIFNYIQKYEIDKPQSDTLRFADKTNWLFLYLFLMVIVYGVYSDRIIIRAKAAPLVSQRIAAEQTADFIKNALPTDDKKYIFANLTTDVIIPSRQGINNILFKNCLVPQMDILEYSTNKSKVVGYEKLEQMLNNGEVEYIIESNPKNPFVILDNLQHIEDSKFKLVKSFNGYLVYKLK